MAFKVLKSGEKSENSAVALGNFDGIHIGHTEIIKSTVRFAEKNGLVPAVFSFESSPANFLKKESDTKNIFDSETKEEILRSLGIKVLYLEDFSKVRDMSCESFCSEIICKTLNAKAVFCGFNFTFGKNGSGNAETLSSILEKFKVRVFVTEKTALGQETVSSTLIRKFILSGNIKKANEFLGRPFSFYSVTEENPDGILSITMPEKTVFPPDGKYAGAVTCSGKTSECVINSSGGKIFIESAEKFDKGTKIKIEFM